MVTVYGYTCRPQFHCMQYEICCNKNPHRFFYKLLIITILNHYYRFNQTSTHLQYVTVNQTQANKLFSALGFTIIENGAWL